MRKQKYIVKSKGEILQKKIIVYIVILFALTIAFVLCIRSFKNVKAIYVADEKKEIVQ